MSVIFGRACIPLVLLVFLYRPVKMYDITGPTKLNHLVGEDASFKWSTNDKSTILSASWGIKKGNIPDPQYINVYILSSRVYINSDLKPDLIRRLSFDGNLKEGRAWFTLKNVTVNDTNEYIADISDRKYRVLPYTVALYVTIPKEGGGQSATTTREPKGLKGEQAVTSPQVRMVQTSKKETKTESDVSKDTKKPSSSNGNLQLKSAIIALCVLAAVLLLITAIAILRKRHACMKGEENRAAPSVKRLQKVKTNVGENPRTVLLEQGTEVVD